NDEVYYVAKALANKVLGEDYEVIEELKGKEVEINRLSKGEASVIPTSETILVCVSPSPSSAKLIRTAS
ncbi:hypothetical protein NE452_18055, partial [Paeniclostridium sordellii]|uniref:hypothetical protein n=1 Tax=Paraclostridium sordellii TaxID=1505 RepID=UPI00210B7401